MRFNFLLFMCEMGFGIAGSMRGSLWLLLVLLVLWLEHACAINSITTIPHKNGLRGFVYVTIFTIIDLVLVIINIIIFVLNIIVSIIIFSSSSRSFYYYI